MKVCTQESFQYLTGVGREVEKSQSLELLALCFLIVLFIRFGSQSFG